MILAAIFNHASRLRDVRQGPAPNRKLPRRSLRGPAIGDWRVPTREELASILKGPCPTSSFSACIDPIFGTTAAARYWSSEESGDTNAYSVSFTNGQVFTESKSARGSNRVRAVRSGP